MNSPQLLEEEVRKLREAFPEEELHPELRQHLTPDPMLGQTLKHPLVHFLFYTDQLAHFANQSFVKKTELVKQADRDREFGQAIWLHERPWRLNALVDRIHLIPPKRRSRLIADVWKDCEFPHRNLSIWRNLWLQQCVGRYAMDKKERETFAEIQRKACTGSITLWRGTNDHSAAARGLSWTTDPAMAEWFAKRNTNLSKGQPVVWEVQPPPHRIRAFMQGRNEAEVILDAKGLHGIKKHLIDL